MSKEKATEAVKANDIEKVLKELEEMSMRDIMKWIKELINIHGIDYESFEDGFSDEQYKRYKYLLSSERDIKRIMSKKESELTDDDWFDLRAADC